MSTSFGTYLARFTDGPTPGDRQVTGIWPLPDEIVDTDGAGRYVKVSESQLDEDVPGIMRGAHYEWKQEANR